jgi:hypothetical protein
MIILNFKNKEQNQCTRLLFLHNSEKLPRPQRLRSIPDDLAQKMRDVIESKANFLTSPKREVRGRMSTKKVRVGGLPVLA